MNCRACGAELRHTFVDLGSSPLSNSYLSTEQLQAMEPHYALRVFVCSECWLVQLPAVTRPEEIFKNYAYFSSFSESWLRHAENYVDNVIGRFGLDSTHSVVEIASNDGYLLQYFAKHGISVLGIEPAANVAEAAVAKGIPTLVKFFGSETAKELIAGEKGADLLLGNNVLAHVPDLNDFVAGMKIALNPSGIISMEFPHLMRLMTGSQFDTIYHEHFSYFSFLSVEQVFSRHGITLFDVEELATHGGSLRIYGCHEDNANHPITKNLRAVRDQELHDGFNRLDTYQHFAGQVEETKRDLLDFLIQAKREGKSVVGYGAAAKGNTLLNYCGIRTDFLDFTVDLNPAKQGCFLPGTRIPVYAPDKIMDAKPDYVLVLPWNLKDEIMTQMKHISQWGGQFVIPIPKVQIIS